MKPYIKDDFRPYVIFEGIEVCIEEIVDANTFYGEEAARLVFDAVHGNGFYDRFTKALTKHFPETKFAPIV